MGKGTWIFVAIVILMLFFMSFVIAGIISVLIGADFESVGVGNVAVIPVKGFIASEPDISLLGAQVAASSEIVEMIEKAEDTSSIKAIVMEINSGGGSPVASDEIAQAIKDSEKPTVAWIREVGASGAYWIASATDEVIAHEMSITGSIGVISSYLQYSGVMEDYNVTYERLVSGKYKDIGTPFKELSPYERVLLQEKIDTIRDLFIDEVSGNRKLPRESVEEIATGMFYLGTEAKEMGLVDELGGKHEVESYLEDELNQSVNFVMYKRQRTFTDILGSLSTHSFFYMGKGIGNALVTSHNENSLRVLT